MRMTSELDLTTAQSAVPKDTYVAHVHKMERKESKDSKAPMRELTWEIEEGDFATRMIPYYTVMMGGLTKGGDPMPLFGLVEFITATQTPWACQKCNSGERIAEFILGTGPDLEKGENGLERGKYHCPDCRQPTRIEYEDDYMMGARCKIEVVQETPEGRERPVNKIKRLHRI